MRNFVFLAPHPTYVFIDSHICFTMYSMHIAVPVLFLFSRVHLILCLLQGLLFSILLGVPEEVGFSEFCQLICNR